MAIYSSKFGGYFHPADLLKELTEQTGATGLTQMEVTMKLLTAIYKTYEGARKRCAFENALARGEFQRGNKAKHYRYSIVKEGNVWRVARLVR